MPASASALTVLMTAYNAMPYIREAVSGILSQEYRDFTFLILNNGSTDGTGEYLTALEREHTVTGMEPLPRICVIHLENNIGRTAVLNKGLELVQSEFTAIMDADDISFPGRLGRQLAFMQANPDVDLLGTDVRYMDSGGKPLREDRFPTSHEALRDRLPLYNQFAHSACMYRTGKARAAGGYSPSFSYAQDLALWVEMLRRGGRAASIPELLTCIRMHPGQATQDAAQRKARITDNYRLAEAMLEIPGMSRASCQAALVRSAGALYGLGRKNEALDRLWRGIREAPLLLPCNPLLWSRIYLEAARLFSHLWRKTVG